MSNPWSLPGGLFCTVKYRVVMSVVSSSKMVGPALTYGVFTTQPRSCGGPHPKSSRVSRRRETRSEEHTSELQSQSNLVCRLLLEKKNSLTTLGSNTHTTNMTKIVTKSIEIII